jgi:hypothetical protein
MKRLKKITAVLMVLGAIISLNPTVATGSDVEGLWFGTWQIPGAPDAGFCGQSSSFRVSFFSISNVYLAEVYIPSFGLFDQILPVTITENNNGYDVSIGVPGIMDISGSYDGNALSGSFSAFSEDTGMLLAEGSWYAEKYTQEAVLPGASPGPPCDDLPPLHCIGDAAYCSELVPFEPSVGDGYINECNSLTYEEDQCYRFIRRDLMMLIKYATAKIACKTDNWDYGSFTPLGLLDMSEAGGFTPGTSFGYLRHPSGTHTNGTDVDTAYYQRYAKDNSARPVGVHHALGYDDEGDPYFYDANHLLEPPYALDKWRTALYIAYLNEHPRLRVVGVDGQIGLVLEEAFDSLVEIDWLPPELTDSIPLAYEVEDTGQYWFLTHHHHMHISMNPVSDFVSRARITPRVLHRKSMGRYVKARIELDDGYDAHLVDKSSLALILSGHEMIWAKPEHVRISDFNRNGIPDLTVKFDRKEVMAALDNGKTEIAVTGLYDGLFFQDTASIRVIGKPWKKWKKRKLHHRTPFFRPGGRSMDWRYRAD